VDDLSAGPGPPGDPDEFGDEDLSLSATLSPVEGGFESSSHDMMPGFKSDSEAQARLATVTQNQSNCLAESARRRDSARGGLLPGRSMKRLTESFPTRRTPSPSPSTGKSESRSRLIRSWYYSGY
jgi:hypothetical protein